MNLPPSDFEVFRTEIEELQLRWIHEDEESKVSNRVTTRLTDIYRNADAPTQRMFDKVLADWVRSPDSGIWFNGCALIREFRVCSALPAVREALAYWRAELVQYGDFSRSGEYGIRRSHALSAIAIMGSAVRELKWRCRLKRVWKAISRG